MYYLLCYDCQQKFKSTKKITSLLTPILTINIKYIFLFISGFKSWISNILFFAVWLPGCREWSRWGCSCRSEPGSWCCPIFRISVRYSVVSMLIPTAVSLSYAIRLSRNLDCFYYLVFFFIFGEGGGGIKYYFLKICFNLVKPNHFCWNYGLFFGWKFTCFDIGENETLVKNSKCNPDIIYIIFTKYTYIC